MVFDCLGIDVDTDTASESPEFFFGLKYEDEKVHVLLIIVLLVMVAEWPINGWDVGIIVGLVDLEENLGKQVTQR